MTVDDIMNKAQLLGACSKSKGVSDWKTISWLFFTPQGIEFCENNNFPKIDDFRMISKNVLKHGVYVDKGEISLKNEPNIALVGNTEGIVVYDDPTKVHKLVLMHGAKSKIKVKGYSVLRLINIGECDVQIEKDQTAVILK